MEAHAAQEGAGAGAGATESDRQDAVAPLAAAPLAAAPKEDALASQQIDIEKYSSTEKINTNQETAPVQATTAQPNRTIFKIIAEFFFYILNLLRSFFSPASEHSIDTSEDYRCSPRI